MAVKKCRYCREEIDKRATVCPHCQKKQGTGCGTILAALAIVAGGAFVLSRCNAIRDGYDKASEDASFSEEVSAESEEDYKASCTAITYEEIARDKEALSGSRVTFTGQVIQTADDLYRVNITKNDHGYTDTIVFDLDSDKLSENILEGDIVTIWGESKGFYSYEAVLGQKVTVPRVKAAYIRNDGQQK